MHTPSLILHHWRKIFIAGLVLLAALVLWSAKEVALSIDTLRANELDNVGWNASQLEVQLVKLQHLLAEAKAGNPQRLLLQRRWDNFLSRIDPLDAAITPDLTARQPDFAPTFEEVKAEIVAAPGPEFDEAPREGAGFAETPAALLSARSHKAWAKALEDHVYRTASLNVMSCPALKMTAAPGGTESEFRAHIAQALREKRDAAVESLRAKLAQAVATFLASACASGPLPVPCAQRAVLSKQNASSAVCHAPASSSIGDCQVKYHA